MRPGHGKSDKALGPVYSPLDKVSLPYYEPDTNLRNRETALSRPVPEHAHSKVFDLSLLEKVASGSKRDVYFIPDSSSDQVKPLLLKMPRYAAHRANQPFLKRALYSLFPKIMERGIVQEARYREALEKRLSGVDSLPLPAFFGFVETSEGRGTLWEAVCDEEGKLAPTLSELAQRGDMAKHIGALNRFVEACMRFDIVAADVHNSNLVLAKGVEGSEFKIVDGFGDHRLISLRRFFRWKNRKSLENRFRKMAKAIGLTYDAKGHIFSVPPPTDPRM